MMGVSLFLVAGCGGEEATGHKDDPTPGGGQEDVIEDMSPDALQDMENVGENPN